MKLKFLEQSSEASSAEVSTESFSSSTLQIAFENTQNRHLCKQFSITIMSHVSDLVLRYKDLDVKPSQVQHKFQS